MHLLLRVDVKQAERWSDQEVVERWLELHPVRNGYFEPVETPEGYAEEFANDTEVVEATREKLLSISQFMKELKQRIAQVANRDEGTTGAFWAGRFKIKAIRDEAQLLATLAYIDLNPFAANACVNPEDGKYTSLEGRLGRDHPQGMRQRLREHRPEGQHRSRVAIRIARSARSTRQSLIARQPTGLWLIPLEGSKRPGRRTTARSHGQGATTRRDHLAETLLPGLSLKNYLQLIDITSRLLRTGKKRLSRQSIPILERLALTPNGLAERIVELIDVWSLRKAYHFTT